MFRPCSFFSLPQFPQLQKSFDLSGCDSFYIPRFTNLEGQQEDFLRGYGIWGGVQRVNIPALLRKTGQEAIGFLVGCGGSAAPNRKPGPTRFRPGRCLGHSSRSH